MLKKILVLVLLLFVPIQAAATLVTYNPMVEAYYLTAPANGVYGWNGWYSSISPTDPTFQVDGASINNGILKIYTGWLGANYTEYGAVASDLFLYSNNNSWAVRLCSSDMGNVYLNPMYQTSVDLFGTNSGVVYGGRYDKNDPKLTPVWAISGLIGSTLVTWGTNEVNIDLSSLPGFDRNNFNFLYSSATCGNGVMTGEVPIPPSILLLLSGFLVLLLRKNVRTNV